MVKTDTLIAQYKDSSRSHSPLNITRQGFLKLAGLGLLRAVFPGNWMPLHRSARFAESAMQGRVTDEMLDIYEKPSLTSNKVKLIWRDSIFPITAATIGDDEPSYNRVWYQIGEEGFVHSGSVQPVRTLVNQPVMSIPAAGALAEVSVPFTDARRAPGRYEEVVYRFYYDTIYWIIEITQDSNGEVWYGVLDDKWKTTHYVLATHLHLIPASELGAISPDVPLNQKRIEVHTTEQVVIAYEREKPVFMSKAATGAVYRDGNHFTPSGRHITFCKRPCRHMAAGDLASNGFDLPGVPWICYITENGVAFHGTYWHNEFTYPHSHGCINLPIEAARWVYLWSDPVVPARERKFVTNHGTRVIIR